MKRILDIFSSLRLTVVLLACGILLVFLGTLAQVHVGTWNAQKIYFQSWFIAKPILYNHRIPIVLPGGYLIGTLLLINLLISHFRGANWGQRNVVQVLVHHGLLLALVFAATWVAVRNPFIGMAFFGALLAADLWISRAGPLKDTYSGKKLGINFTHLGVIMLLLGQLATDQLAVETYMSFAEGERRAYSESHREHEIAFLADSDAAHDEVVAIPESLLRRQKDFRNENLPFEVRVKDYSVNGRVRARGPMVDKGPPPATEGVGSRAVVEPLPEVNDEKHNNTPYAVIELLREGKSLGTWLIAVSYIDVAQEIPVAGKVWRVIFRPRRVYLPFDVQLLKTTHEVYPGTDSPRNFQSRVRVENPSAGESRETDIKMNKPLRYSGLTFYQSQMGRDEADASRGTSVLEVVRNPSWLTPYFGCGAVGYGLARHFLYYLVAFIRKRRTA
jgi:hypothetical protein